ncbi:hypothetical protein GsuE55_14640 [Geobacillus subterraneus]|uniref:Uncharacterized protein n=1 Tax=Geobacillus subterraneus TaxID=129338 RepID=A0A679FY34_9BACL|nr:hypothetical protein GsuE55_14640 [Geobacillus subterraneus]
MSKTIKQIVSELIRKYRTNAPFVIKIFTLLANTQMYLEYDSMTFGTHMPQFSCNSEKIPRS